jgi:hypothetical protein
VPDLVPVRLMSPRLPPLCPPFSGSAPPPGPHRLLASSVVPPSFPVMGLSPVLPSPSSVATVVLPDPAAALYNSTSLGTPSAAPHPAVSAALASPASSTALVVCVLLNADALVRGTFVAFDRAMSPVIHDCVELHPTAGRHVPGPLVSPDLWSPLKCHLEGGE